MKHLRVIQAKFAALTQHQKLIALLLIVCCIALFFKGCQAIATSKNHRQTAPLMIRMGDKIQIPAESPLRTQITTQCVKTVNLPHVIAFPGLIEADPKLTVDVRPPLPGHLTSLKVSLGDVVNQQQILATISSPDLAQAQTENEKAQSALTLMKNALKRAKEVNVAGGNSIKDVQQAENNYLQAIAEQQRTEARLKMLGHNKFSQLFIKAPIKGRITALHYGVGSYINDTTNPLLSISNISSVWVTAHIPENFAGMVAQNQVADIYMPAYPHEILHGKITFVNSFLEPDTRRNKTRIKFANPHGKLQPNMFATVNINVPQPHSIMIPTSALLMNDDTVSVYVEVKPWLFEQRSVQLGTEDGGNVRVLTGLQPGERIVTAGGVFIND
jgi:cobalt-zinc-cadmium efflux system membrane fusion protein